MHMQIENTSDFLKSHNVKPSFQRIRIFDFLNNSDDHPTVDDIYRALIDEIPTLSKTTVYNTLNLFVENNIVNTISIEESEMRYDINDDNHGHFKCVACKGVFDIDLSCNKHEPLGLQGYTVYNRSVYFKGLCPSCNSNQQHFDIAQ